MTWILFPAACRWELFAWVLMRCSIPYRPCLERLVHRAADIATLYPELQDRSAGGGLITLSALFYYEGGNNKIFICKKDRENLGIPMVARGRTPESRLLGEIIIIILAYRKSYLKPLQAEYRWYNVISEYHGHIRRGELVAEGVF